MSTNCTNTPMDEGLDISIDYSLLLVVRGNSDTLAQLCFNYYGGGIVVREANNIGNDLEPHWQPWKKLVFQSDLGDVGTHEQRLQAIEVLFNNFNPIESKNGTMTYTGELDCGQKGYLSVIFDTPFSGIPTITCSSSHQYVGTSAINITQSGFTIEYYNYAFADNWDNQRNIVCTWIAEWALKSGN